ncbi:MAG: hypothetical protein QGD96_06645 [Anaerolineae bacterium]|nr:hypothetical protein [Anaerolineae bacterium]
MAINQLKSYIHKFIETPILFLLVINLAIGLFTYKDFGLSLDEPLFYRYAEAIGYAYSPSEWFGEDFDLINAYGPSPGDHANRGPGYILFARFPASFLQSLGLDFASSWHLINFLTFQVGIFFFYVLCLRWMQPWAAFGAAALLSSQPMIWGHAFINPKDPPFLVFFLITLELGFRMAEKLAKPQDGETKFQTLKFIILPAIFLGLTTNIRVLGPLAAVLAGIYFLTLKKQTRIWWYLPYLLIAYAVMVITWPFLWDAPLEKFVQVIKFMVDNPTTLQVYFYGASYQADSLPLRYLPTLMFITLTETVWPLAIIGFVIAIKKGFRKEITLGSLLPTLGWFVVPLVFVLLRRPPMYDGFRHFLFIILPIFVLAGFAMDSAFKRIKQAWLQGVLIILFILPGILPSIQLHPYQYTYYNQFVGGTGNAALRFETDYWLTCYKESVEQLEASIDEPVNLFVRREFQIAAYYAQDQVNVLDHKRKLVQPGDYILHNSRVNPVLNTFPNMLPYFLRVERDGAIYCEIRKK